MKVRCAAILPAGAADQRVFLLQALRPEDPQRPGFLGTQYVRAPLDTFLLGRVYKYEWTPGKQDA